LNACLKLKLVLKTCERLPLRRSDQDTMCLHTRPGRWTEAPERVSSSQGALDADEQGRSRDLRSLPEIRGDHLDCDNLSVLDRARTPTAHERRVATTIRGRQRQIDRLGIGPGFACRAHQVTRRWSRAWDNLRVRVQSAWVISIISICLRSNLH